MAILINPTSTEASPQEPIPLIKESKGALFAMVILLLVLLIAYFALHNYHPSNTIPTVAPAPDTTNGPASGAATQNIQPNLGY